MHSVFLIVGSNLRRNKGQSFLIGASLAVCALLFSLSLGILQSLDEPFQQMYERQQGSDILIYVDSDLYSMDKLTGWWQKQDGVKGVHTIPTVRLKDNPFLIPQDGTQERRRVNNLLWVSEYQPDTPLDKVAMIKGEEKATPGPNELWLNSALANSCGAKVGDRFELPTTTGFASMLITAIVVDPQFSASSAFGLTRVWVGPGELSWHFSVAAFQNAFLGIRLNSGENADQHWQAFSSWLGGAFNGMYYPKSLIQYVFSFLFMIVAVALLVVSFISLAIAIFMIHTTIQGSILAQFRQIGVLKSLGFTPRGLIVSYGLQSLLIGLAAVPAGILGGFWLLQVVNSQLVQSVGFVSASGNFATIVVVTLASQLALVFAISCLLARKAGNIKVVEAIRLGEVPEKDSGKRFSLVNTGKVPLVLLLALKTLFSRARRLVLTGFTIVLAAFVFSFGLNLVEFLNVKNSDPEFWGMAKADVLVTIQVKRFTVERKVLMDDFKNNPAIQSFVAQDWATMALPATKGQAAQVINGQIYDGDLGSLGLWNLEGRNPAMDSEISIGSTTARDYGIRIGDPLEVVLAGKELNYRVCGIYQTISDLGKGFRLTEAGYRRASPSHQPVSFSIQLIDASETELFIESYEHKYGASIVAVNSSKDLREQLGQQTAIFVQAVVLVLALFAIITLVMIYNATAMELNEGRKVFGIYKTLGMTPHMIRGIMACKTGLIALVCVVLGMGIELTAHTSLLQLILSGLGLNRLELIANIPQLLLTALLFVTLCAACSWFAARSANHIPARNLIVE